MADDAEKTEITELTLLDASRVDAVGSPANGTPWLFLKAAAADCPTCDGSGKILDGNRKCPDCQGSGNASKSDSSEADEQEEEMTEETAKSLCGQEDCLVCAPILAKAKLKAATRNALPKSAFALPATRQYPIHDANHARAALSRSSGKPEEAKVKAAVGKKFPEIDQADAEKSTGVPDYATQLPLEGGHIADTGQSGIRVVPMVMGTKPEGAIATEGGETSAVGGSNTQVIPVVSRVLNPSGALTAAKVAYVVSSLAEACDRIEEQRQRVAKDGPGWMAMDNPSGAEATDIGSGPWESYDSATLSQVATNLAACGAAIGAIQQREAVEAAAGNMGDIADTWDLGEAESALEAALGIVARLAFHEGASAQKEGVEKVGRRLSGKTENALRAAHSALSDVLTPKELPTGHGAGQDDDSSEENDIMATVTKEDLAEVFTAALRQEREARKEAKAKKNANNDGDITEQELDAGVKGHLAQGDLAIPGEGHVNPEYANKEVDEMRKELGEVKSLLEKIAKRPRIGGPNLTGATPTGFAPVSEGRQGEEVAKSTEDAEIENLRKELDETLKDKSPSGMQRASELSYSLTRKQLAQGHRLHQI